MKNLFQIFFLSLLLFSCRQKNDVGNSNEKTHLAQNDTLTKNLKEAYQKGAIMGFSAVIVNERGLVYDNGFGFANLEQDKAYTSGTIQNIGSISKTLIGISLLKAQELGKLNLNDPINKYLPFKIVNPSHPEIPILIKHLAYHTSSIIDLDDVYGKSYVMAKSTHNANELVCDYFNAPETAIPVLTFMQDCLSENGKWYTKNTFSAAKPGEKRVYSNIGAALCALVIERATGQDYRDFTQQNILKPLGMKASGWSSKDIDAGIRSKVFATKKQLIADYCLITYADGGFLTSGRDLGLFLSELLKGYQGNGTLLKKESYKKLFEKHTFSENGKSEDYGIFMEFREKFLKVNSPMIGHNGSDPGVFTAMYFNPDTDYTDAWPEIIAIWKSLSDYENSIRETHFAK